MLHSLHEVSASYYDLFLQHMGWERFRDNLPPDDPTLIVAPNSDMEQLAPTVYGVLGESLTRLFLRNWGQKGAAEWVAAPSWAAVRQQAEQLAEADRPQWAIQQLDQVIAQLGAAHSITDEDSTWQLTITNCAICHGLHNVEAPICTSSTAFTSGVLQDLLGRRVRVDETECMAMGAPHCRFVIYKP